MATSPKTDEIGTGDAIITSDLGFIGVMVQSFLSSKWNHSGIAIRIKDKKVVKNGGDLYVYEIGLGFRKCPVHGDVIDGAGFSRLERVCNFYDKVAVRKIDPRFVTDEFCERATTFINETRGKQVFPKNFAMVDILLGVQKEDAKDKEKVFCSELMAYFYEYTAAKEYERIVGHRYQGSKTLFGFENQAKNVCIPDMYCVSTTPNSEIFLDQQFLIKVGETSTLSAVTKPFLFIVFVCVFVYAFLP
jgi:hypothetical protein